MLWGGFGRPEARGDSRGASTPMATGTSRGCAAEAQHWRSSPGCWPCPRKVGDRTPVGSAQSHTSVSMLSARGGLPEGLPSTSPRGALRWAGLSPPASSRSRSVPSLHAWPEGSPAGKPLSRSGDPPGPHEDLGTRRVRPWPPAPCPEAHLSSPPGRGALPGTLGAAVPACSEPPAASSGAGGYLKISGPSQPCAHSPSSPCCTPRWPSPTLRDLSQGHWGKKKQTGKGFSSTTARPKVPTCTRGWPASPKPPPLPVEVPLQGGRAGEHPWCAPAPLGSAGGAAPGRCGSGAAAPCGCAPHARGPAAAAGSGRRPRAAPSASSRPSPARPSPGRPIWGASACPRPGA